MSRSVDLPLPDGPIIANRAGYGPEYIANALRPSSEEAECTEFPPSSCIREFPHTPDTPRNMVREPPLGNCTLYQMSSHDRRMRLTGVSRISAEISVISSPTRRAYSTPLSSCGRLADACTEVSVWVSFRTAYAPRSNVASHEMARRTIAKI